MAKKVVGDNINNKLALVMRSGKAVLGIKSTIKAIRNGKAKLVFISNNCPTVRKSQIEYYALLAKIDIYHF
jgi:large subunit ribosomal protein L30e